MITLPKRDVRTDLLRSIAHLGTAMLAGLATLYQTAWHRGKGEESHGKVDAAQSREMPHCALERLLSSVISSEKPCEKKRGAGTNARRRWILFE